MTDWHVTTATNKNRLARRLRTANDPGQYARSAIMFYLPSARNSMIVEVYAVLGRTVPPSTSQVLGANLNCSESRLGQARRAGGSAETGDLLAAGNGTDHRH